MPRWRGLVIGAVVAVLALGAGGCSKPASAGGDGGHGATGAAPSPVQESTALTQQDSAEVRGPVTPVTFMKYLNWPEGRQLDLHLVNPRTDLVGKLPSGKSWVLVGLSEVNNSGKVATVRVYRLSLRNDFGEIVDLELPADLFVFVVDNDHAGSATLTYSKKPFYTKTAGGSIFDPSLGTDAAKKAAVAFTGEHTAPRLLIERYVTSVTVIVTEQQEADRHTPGLYAISE